MRSGLITVGSSDRTAKSASLPGSMEPFDVLGLARVGGTPRVGAQRFLDGDRLRGVERGAGGGAAVDHVVDAEQRGARRRPGGRSCRASPRRRRAGTAAGTARTDALRADRRQHPVADLGREPALSDREHPTRRPGHLIGAGGGEVLDPVAGVGRGYRSAATSNASRATSIARSPIACAATRQPARCAAMIIAVSAAASACR